MVSERRTENCVRRHGNRRSGADAGQRRIKRLLLAGALGELQLQLPARLVEQAGDVPRAEQVELRA